MRLVARTSSLRFCNTTRSYAKLHGSYAILQGGSVADALVDLTGAAVAATLSTHHPSFAVLILLYNITGGVAVKWDLGGGDADAGAATDSGGEAEVGTRTWGNKWRRLLRHHGKGHLMGCSLILRGCEGNIDNGQGILFNHACVLTAPISCCVVNTFYRVQFETILLFCSYGIMDVRQLSDAMCFVKVFDPWGILQVVKCARIASLGTCDV